MDRLHAKQNSYKRHTFSESIKKTIHDSSNFKTIFKRDLNRLKQEIELYPNESQIWKIQKITNSAGNLCLHLVGNLNTYIGNTYGTVIMCEIENLNSH
jgi:hypothetical protein